MTANVVITIKKPEIPSTNVDIAFANIYFGVLSYRALITTNCPKIIGVPMIIASIKLLKNAFLLFQLILNFLFLMINL